MQVLDSMFQTVTWAVPSQGARAEDPAMATALRVALRMQARLDVIDIVRAFHGRTAAEARADVRTLLHRWHEPFPIHLGPGSCQLRRDPGGERQLVANLCQSRSDLLIADRDEPWGDGRFGTASVLARLARRAGYPTLVLGDRALVDAEGRSNLRTIVVPVDSMRSAWQLIDLAVCFAEALADGPFQLRFLQAAPQGMVRHGGEAAPPDGPFQFAVRRGSLVSALVDEAAESDADLVLLPLGDRDGGWSSAVEVDRLESLLGLLSCAVLAVPVRAAGAKAQFFQDRPDLTVGVARVRDPAG